MGKALLVMLKWILAIALLVILFCIMATEAIAKWLKRNPQIVTLGMKPAGAMKVISWGMGLGEKMCILFRRGFKWYFQKFHPTLYPEIARIFPP